MRFHSLRLATLLLSVGSLCLTSCSGKVPAQEGAGQQSPAETQASQQRAPKPLEQHGLRFADSEWDFGSIRDDGPVQQHDFEFEVVGRQAVTIVNLVTSCGCTAAKEGKGTYPPGSKGKLPVSYDPKGRRGDDRKIVQVMIEGQKDPIVLHVGGFIDAAFDVTPVNRHLGDLPVHTKPESFEIEFISRDPAFKVKAARALVTKDRSEDRRVKATEVSSELKVIRGVERRVTKFSVQHFGSGEVANWHTQIHFDVEPAAQNLPFFWMHGSFHGALSVSPNALSFQEPTGKPLRPAEIRIATRQNGVPFKVLSAELDKSAPVGLVVEVRPSTEIDAGSRMNPYIVRLSGTMPAASTPTGIENVQSHLIIKTSHPEQPEVKVPLTLTIRPPEVVGQGR